MILSGVLEASKEISRSRRVKRILEVVLAFGNYMNRGNRSNAIGFKVNSLNKMVDTKSSIDKKITLIHYLLTTIERKVRQTFRFHQFDNTMQKLFSSSVIKSSFQILMKNIACSNCLYIYLQFPDLLNLESDLPHVRKAGKVK